MENNKDLKKQLKTKHIDYKKILEEATEKQIKVRPRGGHKGMGLKALADMYSKILMIFSAYCEVNKDVSAWKPQCIKVLHREGLLPRMEENADDSKFFKAISHYRKSLKQAVDKLEKEERHEGKHVSEMA